MVQRRPTPFGIHPVFLVLVYFIVTGCASKFIGNGDAIQRLLKGSGAYSHVENVLHRETLIKSVAGVGMSSTVLSGMFVGVYLACVGPKICVITGILCNCVGLTILFVAKLQHLFYVGAVLCGCGYQCVVNGHFGVSTLFPQNTALVLATMGAGGDISLSMSVVLLAVISFFSLPTETVITYYIAVVLGLCALSSLLLVPCRPYSKTTLTALTMYNSAKSAARNQLNSPDVTSAESQPLVSKDVDEDGPRPLGKATRSSILNVSKGFEGRQGDIADFECQVQNPDEVHEPILWTYSCRKQLTTVQFWGFLPFFILNYCRYKHFLIHCRSLFIEIANKNVPNGNYYANILSASIPFGFIIALGWGQIVDMLGVIPAITAVNTLGVILTVFGWLGIEGTEYLMIVIFVIYGAYALGLGFSYCGKTFGLTNLSTVQGIISTCTGLASIVLDLYWNRYIIETLQSQRIASLIVTVVGVIMYIFPLILWLSQPAPVGTSSGSHSILPTSISDGVSFDVEAAKNSLSLRLSKHYDALTESTSYSDLQCYDAESLDGLQRSARRSIQHSFRTATMAP